MSFRPPREDTLPWYKQFWPWFLMSLPATAVVAGIYTVFLAASDADGLVNDEYYKEGLAVNRDLAKVDAAVKLGLVADVSYQPENGVFNVQLEATSTRFREPGSLQLELFHPTRANNDHKLKLQHAGNNRYVGMISDLPATHWHLTLLPSDGSWKLKGRMNLPKELHASLP